MRGTILVWLGELILVDFSRQSTFMLTTAGDLSSQSISKTSFANLFQLLVPEASVEKL